MDANAGGAGRIDATSSFAEVTVRSEIFRIILFFSLAVVMMLVAVGRSLLSPDAARLAHIALYVVLGLAAYALAMLALLRRLAAQRREIPLWLLVSNVLIESALPTALIALAWHIGVPPREAITAPAIMAYMLVLVLSPLRLRPWASVAAGVVGGVGHELLVVISGLAREDLAPGVPGLLLYSYGVYICIGGLAAGFVAGQLRAHVHHVLAEGKARQRAEQEIAVAADIQRGLMPLGVPSCDGYAFGFWNRPADETGGDYFDWQLLPDGRLVVTLADVSGHGLGPAIMAAFCRAYARAALGGGDPSLAPALQRVNSLLSTDLPPGRFITLAAVLLKPGSAEAEFLSAGHGPILIHRAATRDVEVKPASALPLGVVPDGTFDAVSSVKLAPGDALVLLTDGFSEWANAAGEQFGLERVRQAIIEAPPDPAATIAELRRRVEAFAGAARQTDDLTAVVIRRA